MNPASPRRRPAKVVDTPDYLLMVARIMRAAAERVSDGNVEDLRALVDLQGQLDVAIVRAVRGLRDSGATWEQIGEATGTSRQAAIMKWSRGSDQVPVSRRARSPRLA
jgi:hypothetical protein